LFEWGETATTIPALILRLFLINDESPPAITSAITKLSHALKLIYWKTLSIDSSIKIKKFRFKSELSFHRQIFLSLSINRSSRFLQIHGLFVACFVNARDRLCFSENHLADQTSKSDFLKYSMPLDRPSFYPSCYRRWLFRRDRYPYRGKTEEADGYAKKRTKYVRWLLYEFTTGPFPFRKSHFQPSVRCPTSIFPTSRRDTRPRVERKLNSNCYFNIYHLPRESLGSPSEVWNPPGRHSPLGKMLNARLSASIFQRGFNRCINRESSSAVHRTERGERNGRRRRRVNEQSAN